VVGLELIGIIAAVTGSLLAGETTRRVAARVVASMPESLRQRQEVAERYAVLDRPPRLRDSTRALATSGWTFVFVAFFTVLAATDFSVGFVLVLAAAFSLLWGGTEYSRRRREEDAFLAAITRQQPRGHNRLNAGYLLLNLVDWFGWLAATALAGQVVAEALRSRITMSAEAS
jgi:hypothetical protein